MEDHKIICINSKINKYVESKYTKAKYLPITYYKTRLRFNSLIFIFIAAL